MPSKREKRERARKQKRREDRAAKEAAAEAAQQAGGASQVFLTRQHRSMVAHTPPAVLQARSRHCPHQTRLATR